MRILKLVLAVAFVFASAQSFAHGNNPCKTEWDGCKGQADMKGCVAQAAKTNNNTACMAKMNKHGHHHGAQGGQQGGGQPGGAPQGGGQGGQQ